LPKSSLDFCLIREIEIMNFWKSITHILKKPKEDKWTAEKDAVCFHEDSYRQAEICPFENLSYLKKSSR